MPSSTTHTLHAAAKNFLQKFADLDAAVAAQRSADKAPVGLGVTSIASGVTATVAAENAQVVTVHVDDNAGLPMFKGEPGKRSDFSAERLAEFDADFERTVKDNVWRNIMHRNTRSQLSDEQADHLLAELGYTALPSTKTFVEYSVGGDRGGVIRRTLAGEVSRDDVIALMVNADIPRYSTAQAKADQAFPESIDGNKTELISYSTLRVETKREWPAKSEHAAA